MSHDRVAELLGLMAEHARHVQYGLTDRAEQTAAQVARVADELAAEAERFEERAEELAARGQDIPAAEAAVAARAIRQALAAAGIDAGPAANPAPGKGTKQTAAAAPPAPEQI